MQLVPSPSAVRHRHEAGQSVHPLKKLGLVRQPFLPRQASWLAIDHATDLGPVWFTLPSHPLGLHAKFDGPVDLHATAHHQIIYYATFASVPTGNQKNQ